MAPDATVRPPGELLAPFPRFLLRSLLIVIFFGFIAVREAQPITEALLPLFKSELALLEDTFRIDRLSVEREGADQVVRVEAELARPITLNGQTLLPDPRNRGTASTLTGNVLLPCVLLIAVALAWPVENGRQLATRLLILAPALLLLLLLNAPFVLRAVLLAPIAEAVNLHRSSPLFMWRSFLLGGGAFALALALGACVGSTTGRSRSCRDYGISRNPP